MKRSERRRRDAGVDRAADAPRELDGDGRLAGAGVDARRRCPAGRRAASVAVAERPVRGGDHDPGPGHRDAHLQPPALVGGPTRGHAERRARPPREHGDERRASRDPPEPQRPRARRATSRKSAPAPAKATVISSSLFVLAEARLQIGVDRRARSSCVGAAKKLAAGLRGDRAERVRDWAAPGCARRSRRRAAPARRPPAVPSTAVKTGTFALRARRDGVGQLDAPAVLGAVGEDQDGGGRRRLAGAPLLARPASPTATLTEVAIASPSAVAWPTRSALERRSRRTRGSASAASTSCAREPKATTATRYFSGSSARKRRAEACAAASLVGRMSFAPIEREVSIAMTAVASSERTESVACGRAKPSRKLATASSRTADGQVPAPARRPGRRRSAAAPAGRSAAASAPAGAGTRRSPATASRHEQQRQQGDAATRSSSRASRGGGSR